MSYIAKRSAPGVPTWDLEFDGATIGFMTSFPGEGPMATVRLYHGQDGTTVSAATLHKCLWLARAAYEDLRYDEEANEEYIEDEDGNLARMKYEENLNEVWASRSDMQDPCW
tara:strand:- start:115 stop:450 length:336 start_codon:yes stop_codon:yes gene_type:complete